MFNNFFRNGVVVWLNNTLLITVLGIFSGCVTNVNSVENPHGLSYINSANKKNCKVFFNYGKDNLSHKEKRTIAQNYPTIWDGECKDGYANGLGAEITKSRSGIKLTYITIYKDKIPRYVYFYQSNGGDYALFMGAFGDIFDYIESNYEYGLSIENNGKKLRLKTLRADIDFDMTYSDDRRLRVNSYELRDILLMLQKDEHKYVLRLMRDHKKDLPKSIANYGESLAIVQQYKNKVCGKSSGESSVDSTNRSADFDADSSVDSSAIHHREICELKIDYTAEIEIMKKLIEFLSGI